MNTAKINKDTRCPVTNQNATLYCKKGGINYYINRQDCIIFLSPMPATNNMMDYANDHYETGVYQDYINAKELKILTANIRLNQIAQYHPDKKMLDIGCSAGFFLEAAQARGYDVQGIEFASAAIKQASPTVRDKIVHGDVNQELGRWQQNLDWVSAFDIIEHVHDPIQFLVNIKKILKPDGLLVMSTPDTSHFLRRVMGSSWPMLQPLQHTVLFSRKAMKKLLLKEGFVNIKIEATYKYLTFEYLAKQLLETNKLISFLMKGVLAMTPTFIKKRPFRVNISEFIVFARKPRT